jgi:hypothetical protein
MAATRLELESPFSAFLRTNYSPTEKERGGIITFCLQPLQDIQDIQTEVRELEMRINDLCIKRQRLQALVDDHQALLSPIRKLPPEVLQIIFVECIDPYPSYPVMHPASAPLVLGRVCSGWRQVAYRTPALWNCIHIVIPYDRINSVASGLADLRLQAMKEWLARSGALPLHLSLYGNDVDCVHLTEYFPPTFRPHSTCKYADALLPFAERWASLILRLSPRLLHPWSVLSGRTLSRLRGIALSPSSLDRGNLETLPSSLGFLTQSPLTCMTLNLSSFEMPPFRKDLVTHLRVTEEISFGRGTVLVNFFSAFKSIRSLHFSLAQQLESGIRIGSSVPNQSDVNRGPLVLPFLEHLTITSWGHETCSIIDFWAGIRAPALRSFKFSTPHWFDNRDALQAFSDFMSESSCEELCIILPKREWAGQQIGVSDTVLDRLFSYFEHHPTGITRLIFQCTEDKVWPKLDDHRGNILLRKILLNERRNTVIMPNLKVLKFCGPLLMPFLVSTLENGLAFRAERLRATSGITRSIRRLEVHIRKPITKVVEDDLNNRLLHGTDVRVVCPARDDNFSSSGGWGKRAPFPSFGGAMPVGGWALQEWESGERHREGGNEPQNDELRQERMAKLRISPFAGLNDMEDLDWGYELGLTSRKSHL